MKILLLLVTFFLFSINLFSQVEGLEKRPKIGLVLSGGGAKGLAHIGVLKVLEEAGIRPDYITGTSMGSIVGGLYSIGYSAHELDSFVRRLNWDHLLSDAIPLRDVMPEEKFDYLRFHVELDYTKEGFKMPAGFIEGNIIYELLSRMSMRVAGINSFDDYPIPFRCVSADLLSGKRYIFKEGDFATALRASMSIPSAFAPVKVDSALLVDGGVLDNFPVLLCKEMGADIIIGVNVGSTESLNVNSFSLPTDVLMATATLSSHIAGLQALPYVDLLISPDLKLFNLMSFLDAESIIDAGELAARQKLTDLKKLSQSIDSAGLKQAKVINVQPLKVKICQIRVNGLERTNQRFFMGNLKIEPGDEVTPEDLGKGVRRLIGTRYYSSVYYKLLPLRDGYMLDINANEAEQRRLKFSVHYDNEYRAGLVTNLTLRNIIARGNRLSTTIDISENPRLNTSIINYIGERQRTASRIEFVAENNKLPYYLSDGSLYGTFKHNYLSLSAGFMYSIGTSWELNSSLMLERSVFKQKSGFNEIFDTGISRFGNRYLTANFTANRNTFNRRFFPTRGGSLEFRYKFYFDIDEVYSGSLTGYDVVAERIQNDESSVFSVYAGFEHLFSLWRRVVITVSGKGGFDSRPLPSSGLQFMGGMPYTNRSYDISFVGLLPRERQVDDFGMVGVKTRFRFFKKMHSTAIVNLVHSINPNENLVNPFLLKPKENIWGYGLMFEYDSLLGPVQGGMGRNSSDGRFRWYLGLGYAF